MRLSRRAALTLAILPSLLAAAGAAEIPRDPRDVPAGSRLGVTKSQADLDGGGAKEGILLVSVLTGDKNPAKAGEVLLGVIDESHGGDRGPLLWSRAVSKETGLPAHDGDITAADLDGDGRSELILTFDRSVSSQRVDRWAEIYAFDDLTAPRRVWEGAWELDTRRDPGTPEADRQWFRREVDFGATRRAAGRSLVLKKTTGMIAGRALEPPRQQAEPVEVVLRVPSSPATPR